MGTEVRGPEATARGPRRGGRQPPGPLTGGLGPFDSDAPKCFQGLAVPRTLFPQTLGTRGESVDRRKTIFVVLWSTFFQVTALFSLPSALLIPLGSFSGPSPFS